MADKKTTEQKAKEATSVGAKNRARDESQTSRWGK